MERAEFRLLSLTSLRRNHRSILGKVEQTGARFIIIDEEAIVGELGPLSKAAEAFLAQGEGHAPGRPCKPALVTD